MSAQFQFQASPRPKTSPRNNPANRSLRLPGDRHRLWLVLGLTASLLLTCGCLPLVGGAAWWVFASAGKTANRPAAANGLQVAPAPPRTAQPVAGPPVAVIDLDAVRNAVPQPAAADLTRQRQARRAELQKTIRDAYEKVGKRNPKWDAAARAALDGAVTHWTHPKIDIHSEALWLHAKKAVDAGCDDPMVKYLYARFHPGPFKEDGSDQIALLRETADAMSTSGYPAARRGVAIAKLANVSLFPAYKPTNLTQGWCSDLAKEAIDLLPEAARSKGAAGQDVAYALYLEIMAIYQQLGSRKRGFDHIAAKLEKDKDPQCRIFFLMVKGAFYTEYAWEARGHGWAKDVTPEGWEGMRQRLAEAEAALEKAWELDPNNALVATMMLNVELGQNQGRDRFEMWFQRAMLADGDNVDACARKLSYLQPRWHGSEEEVLAFGRACLATNNWDGGLPLILAAAHDFTYQDRNIPAAAKESYYRQSKVWEDYHKVFGGYVKRFPNSPRALSNHLRLALRCGQEAEVNRQLRAIGDRFSPRVFTTQEITDLKAKARALAAKK